jgi:hypothetical protein
VIQTALLVPEQKSTRKQLSDVAAASGTPHSSRPVLFQFQQPHTPRHRTGNAKQPHTAHADTLCTTTCRPFPARRCRCALALTPPPAQVHRAEKPMAPSPILVRPPALANSPLPPPRCVAAVAAAPAVRTAPAAPFSRLSYGPLAPADPSHLAHAFLFFLQNFVVTWFLLIAQAPYQV